MKSHEITIKSHEKPTTKNLWIPCAPLVPHPVGPWKLPGQDVVGQPLCRMDPISGQSAEEAWRHSVGCREKRRKTMG